MATNKTGLKKYFETGDKPTQTEYEELIDALRHVDDKLSISDTENLQSSLDSKATISTLLNHVNDTSIHGGGTGSSMSGTEIKTAYEAETNTNAFTDVEKQQVAEGSTHIADLDSHTSSNEKIKWNNQITSWQANETFTDEMGTVIRIGTNNRLYTCLATRPFTSIDLFSEAEEDPKKWQVLGASFPSVAVATISKLSIPPDSTLDIFITGAFMTPSTTITIDEVTINNISFPKENNYQLMVVNVTAPSTYHTGLNITLNNGLPITLEEKFIISDGTVYTPDTIGDALFVINSGTITDLELSQGKVRNLNSTSTSEVVKVDLDITGDFEVEWEVTTNNNGETSEGDIGLANKSTPATGRGSIRYAWYHQGANHDYYYNYSTSLAQGPGGQTGGIYKIKRVDNDVMWYRNGTIVQTLNSQDTTEVLNFFICSNSLTTHENIKITLF